MPILHKETRPIVALLLYFCTIRWIKYCGVVSSAVSFMTSCDLIISDTLTLLTNSCGTNVDSDAFAIATDDNGDSTDYLCMLSCMMVILEQHDQQP